MTQRVDWWTVEQTQRLLEICQHTHRASEIARKLKPVRPGVSRNAIIGKVERLRRQGHAIEIGPPGGGYPGQNERGVVRRPRKVQRVTPSCFVPVEEPPVSTPPKPRRGLPPPDAPQLEPVFAMRQLTLLQLGDRMCRWPVGDEPPFAFCGNPTDERSYCPVHCRVAYHRRPV
jgi:hypothetical protein